MVDYKAKQNQMFSAAQLLHDKTGYICVPHAAYYACMQLIMYIWYYTHFHKTFKIFNQNFTNYQLKNVRKAIMF